jgi:hypothetical protein
MPSNEHSICVYEAGIDEPKPFYARGYFINLRRGVVSAVVRIAQKLGERPFLDLQASVFGLFGAGCHDASGEAGTLRQQPASRKGWQPSLPDWKVAYAVMARSREPKRAG